MQATISAIEYYLPERKLTTAGLAAEFPGAAIEKIDSKTGIRERRIAAEDECASDMAVAAARKLFDSGACSAGSIDFVLLCTQTPDHFVPTTACLVQNRLGIRQSAGALDFNLGSSGYVYGLGLAQGLIASGQAGNILLLTAETYSKFLNRQDRTVRTIFGDAATATLVTARNSPEPLLGPFVYGANGAGAPHLTIPAGGTRLPRSAETAAAAEDEGGNLRSRNDLYMNGAEIFNFTLDVVPPTVDCVLKRAGIGLGDVDLFVFHQANRYMLEHLRKRLGIAPEKFQIAMAHCGNTGSSSIPIALKEAAREGRVPEGALAMLIGFGPGLSWAGALFRSSGLA